MNRRFFYLRLLLALLFSLSLTEKTLSQVLPDPATGDAVIDESWIRTYGPNPLDLRVFYRSQRASEGFGTSFQASLTEDSTPSAQLGVIRINWPGRSSNDYQRTAVGALNYTSTDLATRSDQVTSLGGGLYTLTKKDQSQYSFQDFNFGTVGAGTAKLIGITNPHGQKTSINYLAPQGSQPGTASVKDSVTGQALVLSFDGNNRVVKATDPLGRVLSFVYVSNSLCPSQIKLQDSSGRVLKETDYTYDAGYGVLTARDMSGLTIAANTYDSLERVVSQQDGNGNITTFAYSTGTGGGITSVTDRNGKVEAYTFDPQLAIIAQSDGAGNSESWTRDSNEQILSHTDKNGHVTTFAVDGNGNPATVTAPAGGVTQLAYNAQNMVTTLVDPKGQATRVTYDARNNPIQIVNSLAQTTTLVRDPSSLLISQSSPKGGTQTYRYSAGLLTGRTDANAGLWSYGYDANGRLISQTDPKLNVTRLAYDGLDNLVSIVNPMGEATSFAYNSRGWQLSQTDPDGHVTSFKYDNNGNVIQITDPSGGAITLGYDPENRLIQKTDQNNHTVFFTRNGAGEVTGITDGLGNTQTAQLNGMGQPVNTYDAYSVLVAQNAYDPRNLLEETTDGMGRVKNWNFDQDGLAASTEDGLAHTTYFSTDVLGRLNQALDPLGNVTRQGFDADGNRIGLTNALNNTLQFGHDAGGRVTSLTTAAKLTATYTYNSNNTLATIKSPSGQVSANTYDKARRLVETVDGFARTTFGYDKSSRLSTASDNAYGRKREVSKAYNSLGQLASYTDERGNVLKYLYDPAGNLAQITYPDGRRVNYSYDAANRLTAVIDWAGRLTSYTYDKNSRLATTIRPDGSHEERTYDASGVLASILDQDSGSGLIYSSAISTDAAGQTISEIPSPSATYGLAYEPKPFSATYDADNRLATFNKAPVRYDLDGNLVRGPAPGDREAAFLYDARNQLSEGDGVSYAYGVLGERTGLRTSENTSTQFVVDPSGTLSRVLVKQFARLTGSEQTCYVYGLGLIGEETGGVYRAYHFDERGSTLALTDIKGRVTDTFLYGPYGESVKHEGRSETPFQFNGQFGVQTDPNGLLYMRARYYNPAIKRFINQDVNLGGIELGISLNRFAFANGNPVDGIDPFGLRTLTINVQSFICAPAVTAPAIAPIAGAQLPLLGSLLGYGFSPGAQFIGDNRGFLMSPAPYAARGSGLTYRTTQTLILDPVTYRTTQPLILSSMSADTGTTVVIFPDGQDKSAKASPDGFSASVSTDLGTGQVDVTMQTQESNPLVFGSPPIAYTLNLLIDPSNNTIQAAFDHTMFPSFQVFLDGVPAFNYHEQGDAGNLYHFQTDTFSTKHGTFSVPYIVLAPFSYTSWIGYVPEGSAITELLYPGTNEVINNPGFPYPGQITGTPTSTPLVSGAVSTVPITVGGFPVGSMPGTGIYGQLQEHSYQIVSDVYVGYINPSEPNQDYIVRTLYPVAVVDYSYTTGGGQIVLLDSTQIAAYAANGWKTDPLLGGGPQEAILYGPVP